MLPVGRVIAVGPPHPPALHGSTGESEGSVRSPFAGPTAKDLILPYVIPPLALATAPAVLASRALGDDTAEKRGQKKKEAPQDRFDVLGGRLYVHTHVIQLIGTNARVERDELWRYEVGDCVALRSNPDMIVPALPGLCNADD